MKVENALSFAAGIVICGLIVTVVAFMLALLLRESGGFLADLAEVQAAAVSVIFIGTTASMLAFAYRVLSRQPDEVSSDAESKRGKVYREKMDGVIVYQNLEPLAGPTMMLHGKDKTPPVVQHDAAFPFQPEPRMPDSVGVHDDLANLFRRSKENAQ